MRSQVFSLTLLAAAASIAAAPAPSFAQDAAAAAAAPASPADAGKAAFRRSCRACHQVEPGGNGAGPTLAGVMGAVVGSVPGFEYSAALKAAGAKGTKWDDKTMDAFLANPTAAMPDTTMPLATANAKTRSDLIAYLKTLPAR